MLPLPSTWLGKQLPPWQEHQQLPPCRSDLHLLQLLLPELPLLALLRESLNALGQR